MRYLVPIKRGQLTPTPLKNFSQNIIKLKKNFGNFLIFLEGGGEGWKGGRGNFIHSKNSFKT